MQHPTAVTCSGHCCEPDDDPPCPHHTHRLLFQGGSIPSPAAGMLASASAGQASLRKLPATGELPGPRSWPCPGSAQQWPLVQEGKGCCSLPGRPAGALIALHLPSAAPCTPTAVNPRAAPGESPAGKPLSGPASWGPTRAVHQASLSFRSSASSHWNASGFTEN